MVEGVLNEQIWNSYGGSLAVWHSNRERSQAERTS